jgi:hypothetical protein
MKWLTMGSEAPRNSFRAFVLSGERREIVVTDKESRLTRDGDTLGGVAVPRSETRRGNHRGVDRHRLNGEKAKVRRDGKSTEVELVNLSAGGAMVSGRVRARLWDVIELEFGDGYVLEASVRWLKGNFAGLEFAHETKLECSPAERAELLLDVIQRSFPDQEISIEEPQEAAAEPEAEPEPEDLGNRDEKRHPLIWMGEIHYAHDSNPVRLRNVSPGGALLEVQTDYPLNAEVLLDMGDAGQFFATVRWACGDQVGLRFVKPFDLHCLARARPDVAPQSWTLPDFLGREAEADTPWHAKWQRSSIEELRSDLEGYLKR